MALLSPRWIMAMALLLALWHYGLATSLPEVPEEEYEYEEYDYPDDPEYQAYPLDWELAWRGKVYWPEEPAGDSSLYDEWAANAEEHPPHLVVPFP